MKIHSPVIVLGAGASYASKVPGNRTPPLDKNFLREAGELFARKHSRGGNGPSIVVWKRFKQQLRRAGLRYDEVKEWRLEQLSTFLEARSKLNGLQLNQGRPQEFREALDLLKQLVAHVLLASGGQEVCTLHQMLIKSVNPRSVVSFNYDLIVEQTMLSLGLLNWKVEAYRGAKFAMVPTNSGSTREYELPSSRMSGAVPLIKLHGSIHWEEAGSEKGFCLSGAKLPSDTHNKFDLVRVPNKPFLIPPIASKIDIQKGPLRERWNLALHQLHKAKSWIIWGYSFPDTDTISHVLFRTALARNRKKKPIVVVNPDDKVVDNVQRICNKVSVKHFISMECFLHDVGGLVNKS